jgi:hypothetical protein
MWKKHLKLYQKLSGMSRYFRIALVTVQSQGVVLSTWKLHPTATKSRRDRHPLANNRYCAL